MMQARIVAVETSLHLLRDGLQLSRNSVARDGLALELSTEIVERIGAVAPEACGNPWRQFGLERACLPEGGPCRILVEAKRRPGGQRGRSPEQRFGHDGVG